MKCNGKVVKFRQVAKHSDIGIEVGYRLDLDKAHSCPGCPQCEDINFEHDMKGILDGYQEIGEELFSVRVSFRDKSNNLHHSWEPMEDGELYTYYWTPGTPDSMDGPGELMFEKFKKAEEIASVGAVFNESFQGVTATIEIVDECREHSPGVYHQTLERLGSENTSLGENVKSKAQYDPQHFTKYRNPGMESDDD